MLATKTPTNTPTVTFTPSFTNTSTSTFTPSVTATYTATFTLTPSKTPTPSETPTPSITLTPTQLGLIHYDDFSNKNSGWDRINYSNDGLLLIADEEYTIVWDYPGLDVSDVSIEVDAKMVVDPNEASIGVICRLENRHNYYLFEIDRDGYFAVTKNKDNEWISITNWERNEAIKTGLVENHLRVDCIGNDFYFYANETLLARVHDDDFQSGDVGLSATAYKEAGTKALFNDFTVLDPDFADLEILDDSPVSNMSNPNIPGCLSWDEVERDQVGEEICVYGLIHYLINAQSQMIYFQDRDNPSIEPDLRLFIIDAWYSDLKLGDCIEAYGKLRENGPTSYMFINSDELYIYHDPADCFPEGDYTPFSTNTPLTNSASSGSGSADDDAPSFIVRGPEEKRPGDHRIEVRNETEGPVTLHMYGEMFNYTFNIPDGFHRIFVRPGSYTFYYYSCGVGPESGSGVFNSNWKWRFWCE